MGDIKCIENMIILKDMFERGEVGTAEYFSGRLGISIRSFTRLKQYLERLTNMKIEYCGFTGTYYFNPK